MADFTLGRLKFKWRGNWSTSTSYLIDDIVKYGGNTYVAIVNHDSSSTEAGFYTDLNTSSYWDLHTEGLFFKGNWAGSTFYKLNDLVKYGAFLYRTTTQHTSTASFDSTKFEIYAEGLQWEDSYDASTTYQEGDVVTYGGYSYVAATTTVQGVTPIASASEWDLLSPGFSAQGDYDNSTAYKTGHVVNFGGNSFVCIVNTSAGTAPTDTSKWTKIGDGIKWNGAYSSGTTYYKGDAVLYSSSSYIAIADGFSGVTPGTDATKWELVAQGDTSAQLTTQGDIQYRDSTGVSRLPIGVTGAVLTVKSSEPVWKNPEGRNVLYVANTGDDTNPGTAFLPFKTINKALAVSTRKDILDIDTIAGGNDGTADIYDNVSSTGGSGSGASFRVTTDGSSTPTVEIINGGSGYTVGDTITIAAANIGTPSTNLTFNVVSVSVGDVVYVKNGVYRETLPLKVPQGVTVQGDSLRGTEVRPASGSSTTIATVDTIAGGTGGTPGTYNYVEATSDGDGAGMRFNVVTDGSSTPTVTVYHGGYGHAIDDTITIAGSNIGSASDLTFDVASLENNDASYMWLLNNQTNIVQMSFQGMTGNPVHSTDGAVVCSLDPAGSISTASPYIQNCTSINAGATGIKIDGNLHSGGNKSILANDFTQINSDGEGVHAAGGGRGEMVSVFTYYCDTSFKATSGGFIRGLNCSSAYGEKGAVADGTLAAETPVSVQIRGENLFYDSTGGSFKGAATESDVEDCITTQGQGSATVTGDTSGATATIFKTNVATDALYIENRTGNFQQGETVTVTKEDSSTFQMDLTDSGDSSNAQVGIQGFLITLKSTDGTLGTSNAITLGSNLTFSGDSNYYRVSAVSDEDTSNETATVRLTVAISAANAKAEDATGEFRSKYSNIRLTGHDFLDIGTGDFTTTNYPGTPTQPADQADEVNEDNGGRVYFSSTDQSGDFRVGDLFRIEQATGIATLNADAFDLSGLNELQLGSIGAELGATINEFSTDENMTGDSNAAVPTERAVRGFLTRDKMGVTAFVPPTGTTAERPTGDDLFSGALRFNTTLTTWEGYNGNSWTGIGGGNPWVTKTGDGSTAATSSSNDRLFVDTSGGSITITLPASPLTGDSVRFLDLAGTFGTNALTVGRNGNKIMNLEQDLVSDTDNAGFSLTYSGETYGWLLTDN